jgi:hypothetical protein
MQSDPKSFDEMVTALRGKLASIGVDNVSTANACFCCGHQHRDNELVCKNCNAEFWCHWQANWYESPFTRISLGQVLFARKLSNVFAGVATALLVVTALASHLFADIKLSAAGIFAGLTLGGLSVYEIWSYCHGKATSIDHCTHAARPANTSWRTFGLLLDLLALIGAFYILAYMR